MAHYLQPGDVVLGRYEIIDMVAMGGQGALYRGRDQQTGEAVAIKQLLALPGNPSYEQDLARFRREAQVNVKHRNVVEFLDLGEENGQWFSVMVYVEGHSLEACLAAAGGRLPAEQALRIFIAILEGLQAIHCAGLVHRDLKPDNIIIRPDGSPCTVDMGICRDTNVNTIARGEELLGTVAYMSPEQVDTPRDVDARSDLYSAGAVFYKMLTGQPVVEGKTPTEMFSSIRIHIPAPPQSFDPSIPQHLSDACMRLLAKDRAQRFLSAEEALQAVQGVPQPSEAIECPSCRAHCAAGSAFCGDCGASLTLTNESPVKCIACGAHAGEENVCHSCGRLFSESDHRLQFQTGSLTYTTFRIPEGIFLVGRDQLEPRDQRLSRRHLFIACLNGTVIVQDAGSANRTYAAGHLADRPLQLRSGDELRMAGCSAIYTVTGRSVPW